jgi:hypothetical protein
VGFKKNRKTFNQIFFQGKNMKTLQFAKTFFLIPLLLGSATFATTYYIDTDGNDLNSGTSWATAYKTIQKGVDAAIDSDVVEVNEGFYFENIVFNGDDILLTTKDPNNMDPRHITGISTTDIGVTFENGEGRNCVLAGFYIGAHIGVFCDSGTSPTIRNCTFTRSTYGLKISGSPLVTNCKFRNENKTSIWGVYAENAIIRNNLINNDANGILLESSLGQVVVTNNTIADMYGIGIKVVGTNQPLISNCILWSCKDSLDNCSASYSCINDTNDANGIGNISENPFVLHKGETVDDYHLKPNSMCINAGDPNFNDVNQSDIDGESRIVNSRVDMGADEAGIVVFRFRDNSGNDIAWIDNSGNMTLMGSAYKNSTYSATSAVEFRFLSTNSNDVLIIDANSGNMYIDGTLYENQAMLTPSGDNNFIVKNAGGTIIAYADNAGNLYLKGMLYEQALHKKTVCAFALKNSYHDITVEFDNSGNLFLKGIIDINTTPISTIAKELKIRNADNCDIVVIDADSGNMFIKGLLYENQAVLAPVTGSGNFIIRDEDGDIVSYINNFGDLYLKGTLREQELE